MYYPSASGLWSEYRYCYLAIKAKKSNVAFVLPKGLIEGQRVCPVSCLVIKGSQALEVDVLGHVLRNEMTSQITEEVPARFYLSPFTYPCS